MTLLYKGPENMRRHWICLLFLLLFYLSIHWKQPKNLRTLINWNTHTHIYMHTPVFRFLFQQKYDNTISIGVGSGKVGCLLLVFWCLWCCCCFRCCCFLYLKIISFLILQFVENFFLCLSYMWVWFLLSWFFVFFFICVGLYQEFVE